MAKTETSITLHAETGKHISSHTLQDDIAIYRETLMKSDAMKLTPCCDTGFPDSYHSYIGNLLFTNSHHR